MMILSSFLSTFKAMIAIKEPSSKTPVVYTIGYEGVSIEKFIRKLESENIQCLLDVRRNPLSRKPGFSKKSLQQHLQIAGIEYRHIPQLGIPSSMRQGLNTKEDYSYLFDQYEQEILPVAEREKNDLIEKIAETNSALLCFEADPDCCHRSRLSRVIAVETGYSQKHLQCN